MKLNKNLRDFWYKDGRWTKARYKILAGGRASSKSHDACGVLVQTAVTHKINVVAVRMFQNRIADSVYSLLVSKINEAGYQDYFTMTNNKIVCNKTGSTFKFFGIARNLEEIKSLEGTNILYIEEAADVTKEMWDVLIPTIRTENSEIWAVFNPQLITDHIYQKFFINTPPNAVVRRINYDENPFLSNTMLEEIENYKDLEEEADFNHLYLGEPKTDDDEAIIKRAWLLSCVDAHIKLDLDITGGKKIGFDVADSGEDLNAYILMDGGLISDLVSWKGAEDELFESAQKVFMAASQVNAKVNYDSNGVGAGVGSNMKQMNMSGKYVEYSGFDSAASPCEPHALYRVDSAFTQQTNTDYFENRKAQAWWLLADRFKATHRAVTKGEEIDKDQIISISGDINKLERLITELSTPRKKQSGRLKNIVEKKDDLKKRGIKSPNFADALVMAAFPYDVGRTETQSFTLKGL